MTANAGILFDLPTAQPLSPGPVPPVGGILSGCSYVFYLTTTTTPTPVYSDGALSVPLGNTINANASGQFPAFYLDPSVTYRWQLWTGNNGTGTKLQDVDPYVAFGPGSLSNNIIGQLIYPQTQAEALASITPSNYLFAPGDPRRYGWNPLDSTGVTGTPALQASLSVTQQTFIPAGLQLYTTGAHTMVANSSLVGPGQIVQVASGSNPNLLNITTSNVLVNRVTLNAAAQTGPNRNAIVISGAVITDVEISDCTVISGRILENGNATTRLKVLRNVCTGNSVGNSNSGGVITFGSTAAVNSFLCDGNLVYSTDGTGIILYNGCLNGSIVNNRCTSNFGDGIGIDGGSAGFCIELAITGNICKFNGLGNSGGGVGISHHSAGTSWPERNTITGNVCAFNTADGFDIVSSGTSAQYTYITITGNISEGNGTNGSGYLGGGTGFNLFYCSSATVTGNFAIGNSTHGYEIFGGSNLSLSANQAVGNGSLTPGTYNGFNLNSATNCTLLGNIANNLGAGANQNYGIHEDGGCNGNVFSGNNCTNNITGTTFVQGATSILRDDVGGYIDQAFTLNLSNNAGTLQHSIYAQSGANTLGSYASRINNATASATNTPTGTDSTTAMAGGAKIGSAGTNDFWFDTASQTITQADLLPVVVYNDTGNTFTVRPQIANININGVSQNRMMWQFMTLTGTAFALTTANIPAGKTIQIQFKGKLN